VPTNITYRKIDYACALKAILWLIGNAAFGLMPLWFLLVINNLLIDNHNVAHEIHVLLKGGVILFVCCALMGAVSIDILTEKLPFKRLSFLAVNIVPFLISGIISLIYLLIILGHASPTFFMTFSKFHTCVVAFTIVYCIGSKYLIFITKK
jgi:hypothetical protein